MMEKTIKYRGLESVCYKFTKGEVQEALMKAYEIKHVLGGGIEFDFEEDKNGNTIGAYLNITYDTEAPKQV